MDTAKQDRIYREATKLIRIIETEGFKARFAGGCVRDRYLGRPPKDYDIASSARPEDLIDLLTRHGIKSVPTGIKHGTVTAVMKFSAYEITTLRTDQTTDGRHAQVEFGTCFEEDSNRRDFTCNAMFEDVDGNIFDFHDGRKDLDEGILRFVGDPTVRIHEDYLRILRLFRFWARLSCAPSRETLTVVEELGSGLLKISQERSTSELFGILACPDVEASLGALFDSQIILMVLPDAHPLSSLEIKATQRVPESWRALIRLSLLLKDVKDEVHLQNICSRLKLSRLQANVLEACNLWGQSLAFVPPTQANIMALVDQCELIGKNFFLEALIPCWELLYPNLNNIIAKAQTIEETKGFLRKSPLPISTKDLMVKMNLVPGPKLGEIKRRLLESYRNEEWRTLEEGEVWLESHVGEMLSE